MARQTASGSSGSLKVSAGKQGSSGSGNTSNGSKSAAVKRTGQGRTMHITDSNGNTKHVYGGQTYSTAEAAYNARNADAAIRAEQAQQRKSETWNPLLDQAQQSQPKTAQEEAQQSRYTAEANAQKKQQGEQSFLEEANAEKNQQSENDQHAENYRSYLNEADRLAVEKTNSEGLTMEEQDEYDRRIKEAKNKAEEERKAAGIKNTKDKWDELRSTPALSDDEQEAWAFLGPNEDVENQVGGWGRQFASGPAMAVGTALEWFDKTSDDMVRYEYDQEHGEGAYDAAIAGKNVNQVGRLGNKLWDTGVDLRESGQQMWEAGIEDMSDLGKEIATVAKAGADLAADAGLNFVMPGLGTMRMYMGAMGDASYEQSQRENNDIDSRMLSMIKAGASAYLSNKLVGDVIYGKGIIPKGIDKMLANVSPEVQKVVRPLLNSEGVQEGVENIMNWGADIILGLDTGKPLDWNEVKQDAFIGYVLGVLTNGLSGGMNIDAAKQKAIAQGGVEFAELAEQVGDIDAALVQAAEIGKQNTRDQVVMKASEPEAETTTGNNPQPQSDTETVEQPVGQPQQTEPEAEAPIASEPVENAEAPAPAAQPQTQAQADVIDILMHPAGENGKLSNSQVRTITSDPTMLQAFQEITGTTPDTSSASNTRNSIKDAGVEYLASQQNQKTEGTNSSDLPRMSMEDFANNNSSVWNNVEYDDKNTQNQIQQSAHDRMVNEGKVVVIPDETTKQVSESFPDLRSMKKKERVPILMEKMQKLKSALRKYLGGLQGGSFEFEVNGNILEAKLYETGIKEVIKDVNKNSASMLFNTPEVFKNAEYLYSTPDYDNDSDIYRWNYFYTPVQIGNDIVGVRIAVRDMIRPGESQIYNWGIKQPQSLGGGEVARTSGPTSASSDSGVLESADSSDSNVPQGQNSVNTEQNNPSDEKGQKNNAESLTPAFQSGLRDSADTSHLQNGELSGTVDDQSTEPTLPQDGESVNTDSGDAGEIGGPADQGKNQGNQNASDEATTQEGNDTTGGNPNQNSSSEKSNPGQNGGNPPGGNPPINDRSAPGTGKEKTSQTFSNTLTREEGDSLRDPLTYLSKSDVETTQRAMERLGMNGEAEMATLMSKETWNDEQVQMSNIIRTSLFADAQKTGDWTAYDSFRKVYDEHMRVIARALRQAGNYDGQTAEGVARMAGKYLDMMENKANDDLKRNPNDRKAKDDIAEIKKARQATNETAGEIGALEAEEAELIKNGATEEEAWNKVKDRYLDLGQKLVAQRNMGLIFDNILLRNARIRNGAKNVNTLLRKMLSTRSPEYIRNYVRANNAGLATDATYKMHPTAKQAAAMVSSFHKMCMLFGTGTTLRNTESNAVFGALDWASNNTGGAIADSVIRLMTGNRARGMEAGILSGNTWKAAINAGLESVLEISANMDMREDGKYVNGTQAFSPYNPGARLIARLNQVLGYALNTTDAVAYAGAQESAANAAKRANERRGGNMTDETAEAIGKQEAAFRTLKDQNVATELLGEVQQAFDLLGFGGEIQYKTVGGKKIAVGRKGGYGLGSFNVPFVGVPVNLKLKPLQYSAPGAALGAIHAAQAVKLAKGAAPNSAEMQESLRLQHQASGEIGRGVTGTALLIVLRSLLKKAKDDGKEWFKDWDLEEDKDVKAQNRAEGKFGQQINLSMLDRIRNGEDAGRWQRGDETVDISSNEPTNSFLQMASIMADDEDASTPEALFKALWQTEKSNLSDLPCLDAINNFRDTYNNNPVYNEATETDEEGNAEEPTVNEWKTFLNATGAMAGSSASGFTFAPLRHAAAVRDEYQRDTTGNNPIETAWNRTLLGIPGKHGRESLPIKTDSYGNELTNGDRNTRIKNTYLAMKYGTIQQSEVSEEVERIREETGVSLTPSRYAPKTVTFGSGKDQEKVRLTAEEGKEYTKAKGQEFERRYQELMENPLYQNADSDTQAAMGSKMEAFAKDSAKADVAENHGIEYESKFDYAREMDDPVAFLAAQAGIAQAEKDGNLDAVDMILQSVRNQNMSRQEEETYGKHIQGFNRLNYLTDNGMRTERAQEFDNDLKSLYESEKRTAARGSDYFRTACSGKYNATEADAIMSYETAVTMETENNYKDRIQYNLNQANLGSMQGTVWGWIEECADGNMTTDQFNKNLNKAGIPGKQQYEIKQIRESMTEDKHVVGKTVSGVYRAMREVGYTPEQAYQFYEMIDADYNGSYKKSEFDKACAAAFGSNWKNTEYGRQVRELIKEYVGK